MIGEDFPETVEFQIFPDTVYTELPEVRSYRYAVRDDDIYVIAPSRRAGRAWDLASAEGAVSTAARAAGIAAGVTCRGVMAASGAVTAGLAAAWRVSAICAEACEAMEASTEKA